MWGFVSERKSVRRKELPRIDKGRGTQVGEGVGCPGHIRATSQIMSKGVNVAKKDVQIMRETENGASG